MQRELHLPRLRNFAPRLTNLFSCLRIRVHFSLSDNLSSSFLPSLLLIFVLYVICYIFTSFAESHKHAISFAFGYMKNTLAEENNLFIFHGWVGWGGGGSWQRGTGKRLKEILVLFDSPLQQIEIMDFEYLPFHV